MKHTVHGCIFISILIIVACLILWKKSNSYFKKRYERYEIEHQFGIDKTTSYGIRYTEIRIKGFLLTLIFVNILYIYKMLDLNFSNLSTFIKSLLR